MVITQMHPDHLDLVSWDLKIMIRK